LSPDAYDLLKRAGIDTGVRRIGGRRDRYDLLLRNFAAQEAQAVDTIRSALAAGDKTLAERTAHSLKGAASTLGVNVLASAAAGAEAALKASLSLDGELDTLSRSLAAVVEAVRAEPPEPASGAPEREVRDRVAVQQWLIRLKRLLETDDPEVIFILAEAKPHLSQMLTVSEMRSFDSRIAEFDFGPALKCIASIGARLSLTLEGE
jgi:two-component system sensor histidine kinase/response regulator